MTRSDQTVWEIWCDVMKESAGLVGDWFHMLTFDILERAVRFTGSPTLRRVELWHAEWVERRVEKWLSDNRHGEE